MNSGQLGVNKAHIGDNKVECFKFSVVFYIQEGHILK